MALVNHSESVVAAKIRWRATEMANETDQLRTPRYRLMTAAAAPTNFALIRQPVADNPALLNLLIVDDERSVRDACREAATALGYHTLGVESAEQALRAVE